MNLCYCGVLSVICLCLSVNVLASARAEHYARLQNLDVNLAPVVNKSRTGKYTHDKQETKCSNNYVEILVSPLIGKSSIRLLELLWDVEEVEYGDWIGLYISDPIEEEVSPVFTVQPTTNRGWRQTPVQEKLFPDSTLFKPYCLGFWAVYWRGRQKVAYTCLQTNPTWMADNKDLIGNMKLRDLFLPGTHDSAAYLVKHVPFSESRYQKYVFTQDETILIQLIHGARYLDLRVGRSDGKWWAYHGFAKLRPLQGIIDDVSNFLSETEEIVIIDFHGFPRGFGKGEKVHEKFFGYLEVELSEHMATPVLGWESKLNDIWSSDKRLIVSYNHRPTAEKMARKLWRPVRHKWANTMTMDKLKNYFSNIIGSKPQYTWSAMAQLTPNAWAVLSNKLGGLRRMADVTNKNVTWWFRGDWGRHCNIVALDFIRGSGIVNAAVDWNLLKASDIKCYKGST